jgi:phosphoglycolate phosphatase
MPIKLIIFDLDGTLVDTVQDITNALNYALMSHGIKNLTVSDTEELVGEGVTRLVEKVLPTGKEHLKEDVMTKFLDYYSEHMIDNSKEYPNVRETLENLAHFKKSVISNKREALSKRLLKGLGLAKYFDLIIGSNTAGEKKPSAKPVLYVVSKLNVSPGESIVVGDSYYDIEAGKRAGIRTVAVTYGYQPKELLREADYLIEDLRELISLIYEMEKITK